MSTLLEASRALLAELDPWPWTDSLSVAVDNVRAAIAEAEQAPAVVTAAVVTAEEIDALIPLREKPSGRHIGAEAIAALVAERTAHAVAAARAEEREACARVAYTVATWVAPKQGEAERIRDAIRARTPASEAQDPGGEGAAAYDREHPEDEYNRVSDGMQERDAAVGRLVKLANCAERLLRPTGPGNPAPAHPQFVAQVREELRAALDAMKEGKR